MPMFKWTCYITAVVATTVVILLLVDLKRDVGSSLDEARRAVETVNDNLPEIVAEVKTGTATLSRLSEDVELIKSVAGVTDEQERSGVRGLAIYADEIQKVLARETADHGVDVLVEEIIGSDLKRVESAEEFLVGLNREMITVILPLAKSRQEVLYRASHSGPPRRKPFYLGFPGEEPVRLDLFVKRHHAASADLPAYAP
jgi:hypothetical protein